MIKILTNLVFIIFIGLIQVSFLTTWPAPVSSLNLLLSIVIFLAVVISYKRSLWWAFGGGLFLELFTNSIFGLVTLSLLVTLVLINFLFNNFFTNRSLYTVAILGIIGTLGYNLIFLLFNLLMIAFGIEVSFFKFDFWSQFFWQPFFNFLILVIIFLTYYISTSRLKNIFLLHSNLYETKK